jgi:hypothetical protein
MILNPQRALLVGGSWPHGNDYVGGVLLCDAIGGCPDIAFAATEGLVIKSLS